MENLNLKKIYNGPVYLKVIIFALASVSLLLLTYFFDIKNLNQQYDAHKDKIENIKLQYSSLIRKQIALSNETAEFDKLTMLYSQLKKQIAPYTSSHKVIDELLKAGAFNNIYFANFNPTEEIKRGTYTLIPLKLSVVGSYRQLASFLSQVAAMPYIVLIGDFTIANASAAKPATDTSAKPIDSGNVLTANFNMEVYSLAK